MDLEPIKYIYQSELKWTSERKGMLRCKSKPVISVACAPEFGGHSGFWSPEDLFVGAIEVCAMATFLWLANRKKVTIRSYESKCEGIAQMAEGSLCFTSIHIKARVGISNEEDRAKVKKIFQDIGNWCLISKSIKPKVKIQAKLFVNKRQLKS